MYENRIKHLKEAHASLNKKIDGMESTGVFEDANLHDLKVQRLHYKQELDRLEKLQNELVTPTSV